MKSVPRDIAKQSVADWRLKLQERQYRLLFQTNPNPMWVFAIETLGILAVNDAAISQYGYSQEEFLKLTIRELRLVDEIEKLETAVSQPGAPAHLSGEFRHLRKDKSLIRGKIYSSRVIWDGREACMVTAIDVTDRRDAEERLREQADIIDRAQDAIVIRDANTRRVILWNKGAERLHGWSAEEMRGQTSRRMGRGRLGAIVS